MPTELCDGGRRKIWLWIGRDSLERTVLLRKGTRISQMGYERKKRLKRPLNMLHPCHKRRRQYGQTTHRKMRHCITAFGISLLLLRDCISSEELAAGRMITMQHHANGSTVIEAIDALRWGRKLRFADRAKRRLQGKQVRENGYLRNLQNVPALSFADSLETCQAELEELRAAAELSSPEAGPSFFFVQLADRCILDRTDKGNYVLKSKSFHPQTEVFSDRPFRYEFVRDTVDVFDDFHDTFNDESGLPNAAVTFVRNDGVQAVVVSAFVKAGIKHEEDPNGATFLYKLKQSEEQASVNSLSMEKLMDGRERVVFDHCSFFIDMAGCVACDFGSANGDACGCGGLAFA